MAACLYGLICCTAAIHGQCLCRTTYLYGPCTEDQQWQMFSTKCGSGAMKHVLPSAKLTHCFHLHPSPTNLTLCRCPSRPAHHSACIAAALLHGFGTVALCMAQQQAKHTAWLLSAHASISQCVTCSGG
jgi:hypothetical protein